MERAGRLLGRLKLPAGAVSHEELARAAWPVAVGKIVASHTRPGALVRGRLIVEVEDAIWQRQLFTLRSQIVRRIGEVLDQAIVEQVEFRIGVPRRLPQREERAAASTDEADRIEDPVLRLIYKQHRKRASA